MLIDSATLAQWLVDGSELALVDAREEGVFFHDHLFHAACIPLSRLELDLPRLVPRRDVRVVWCDDGESGLAERAAHRSRELGWTDVSVLEGGTGGWRQWGGELYSGVNVPSKAFGEFVEHTYDTPRIPAKDLDAMLNNGSDVVVLDSRPVEEYRRMTIPTSIDCPGAELVHRVMGVVDDPATLVVVNCAGRTRSIIGAQSLINAGVTNRVVALENGTMGWELAGLNVEHGQTRFAADPTESASRWAIAAAESVAERFGVTTVDSATVGTWIRDSDRTTYLLDVRTPEEYSRGHLPGSSWAPGGQLVQATDEYVATRNARLVLIDDNGVRANMTASWLRQLGWDDTYVLAEGLVGDLEPGAEPSHESGPSVDALGAAEVHEMLGSPGLVVLDLGTSLDHRDKGHVPGAWWAVRSRMSDAAAALDAAGVSVETVVLSSFDDALSRFAHGDALLQWPGARVVVLDGGLRSWIAEGHEIETGIELATTATNDVWYKPYDMKGLNPPEEDMQAYLTWEVALVEQLDRDDTVAFPSFS